MSASAGDFHPMLQNSRKPCGKRVECRWIEQEIRHHDEWHEDQQSIDPVPNGWRQWILVLSGALFVDYVLLGLQSPKRADR